METIASFLSSLDKKTPLSWILLIFMIFVVFKLNIIAKDMSHIQADLNNHITETNKKIEKLSDRFDRLYEVLLKDKQNKSK